MLHGFVPEEAVRNVNPRPGEYTLREEDILDILTKEGPSIALVLFSGIQYYTGQWFPMEPITRTAHKQVCLCAQPF
jgi:kynureninase